MSAHAGIVTTDRPVAEIVPARRGGGRLLSGAAVTSLGMGVSGLLAYVFLVLAARTLGAEAYGQIAALWGALFLVTIVLFRPLEQTVSRAFAHRLAREQEVRSVVTTVGAVFIAMVLALCVAFAVAWDVVTERLFLGNPVLTSMLAVGTVGYGICYLLRGVFGGVRWFGGYGLVLVVDAAARVLIAAPLVVAASVDLAAAALAFATIVGAVVPLWAGRRIVRGLLAAERGEQFELASALRFAAPASVIAGADQLLVNGAPVLVVLEGGSSASKAAGVVFAATMLVRIPVYMFQGLAASLLPNITRMQAGDQLTEIRRGVTRMSVILLAVGTLIVAGAVAVGPQALELLFGGEFDATRTALALLAVGVGCYLASATMTQALLAVDSGARAASAWAGAAVLFVVLFLVIPGAELNRVAVAFAASMVVCLVGVAAGLAARLAQR
jgi:O-antigen/teichoic acid export membrane protein